jgi:phenylalanyl-tRNA synthetase beta chain
MITIANPKTTEFQTGRTTLIPGLLKTLKSNQSNKVPLSVFEIGDIILKADSEIGSKNQRNLCAMFTDHDNSGLELIHGLMDLIMKKINVKNDL